MARQPRILFVDTGAFLAWEMERDQYHQVASDRWEMLAGSAIRLVTSDHVLDETLTLLGRRSTDAHAATRGEDYLQSETLEVVQPSPADLLAATRGMKKFADRGVSFTDCLSVVIMKREGIRSVFGFDRHFEAAGFRLWQG